jgi:hypothetical protein
MNTRPRCRRSVYEHAIMDTLSKLLQSSQAGFVQAVAMQQKARLRELQALWSSRGLPANDLAAFNSLVNRLDEHYAFLCKAYALGEKEHRGITARKTRPTGAGGPGVAPGAAPGAAAAVAPSELIRALEGLQTIETLQGAFRAMQDAVVGPEDYAALMNLDHIDSALQDAEQEFARRDCHEALVAASNEDMVALDPAERLVLLRYWMKCFR